MAEKTSLMSIALVVLMILCLAASAGMLIKVSEPIKVSLNGYKVSNSDIYDGDVKDFVILAQRFASNHEYTDTYKCLNYTEDLAHIAQDLGFKVQKIKGWPDNNTIGHAWLRLEVDFDPQLGRFVDYSKDYPDQEVYK